MRSVTQARMFKVSGPVAAEIRRYIDQARLQRPALIGHSLGGQIALRVAAADGRRIRDGTVRQLIDEHQPG